MYKLNIQFSEKQSKALDHIAEDLGKTKSEVIRLALSLLTLAIRERRDGNTLAVVNGRSIVKGIVGIWD